jgi:hypothetical protein
MAAKIAAGLGKKIRVEGGEEFGDAPVARPLKHARRHGRIHA